MFPSSQGRWKEQKGIPPITLTPIPLWSSLGKVTVPISIHCCHNVRAVRHTPGVRLLLGDKRLAGIPGLPDARLTLNVFCHCPNGPMLVSPPNPPCGVVGRGYCSPVPQASRALTFSRTRGPLFFYGVRLVGGGLPSFDWLQSRETNLPLGMRRRSLFLICSRDSVFGIVDEKKLDEKDLQ
ncbi:hypothetical protein PAMP_011447 [Pampus punctatissimus]